jgi:1-phosphatidylinositol-3-phosphate 5-kinase
VHLSVSYNVCHYLQSPLSIQEHHLSLTGCSVPVVVYENEPSSIIAYALSSQEYQRSLDDMLAKRTAVNEQATPRYFLLNSHFRN